MNAGAFVCLMLLDTVSGCAHASTGSLIVYSATYAATVEQSEYPVHTDYVVATTADRVIEHVSNRTGSFYANPTTVALPSGKYHVRAQYDGGRFVVVPVLIETNRTTVVDLDGEPLAHDSMESVRLPDGRIVGWQTTTVR